MLSSAKPKERKSQVDSYLSRGFMLGCAASLLIFFGAHALTQFATYELESGSKTPPAASIADSTASAGDAVKFSASTGGSSCAYPLFPDEICTGVPNGTNLTAYSGPSDLAAGTVIDGKLITSCLTISQPGVIIRNSRITCGTGGIDAWITSTDQANWAQIIDSEVICTGGGSGIGERGFIVQRVEVTGCENGFDFDQDGIIEDSYIHSLDEGTNGDGHGDGIQSAILQNITIRHNTIIGRSGDLTAPGNNATSAIITPPNGTHDALIEKNFLAGGAYTLYCPENGPVNVNVLNNTFAHQSGPLGAAFGYLDGCNAATLSGNVTDQGDPVTP